MDQQLPENTQISLNDSIIVCSKEIVNQFLSESPTESFNAEFLVNFSKYSNSEIYITGNNFSNLSSKITDSTAMKYLQSGFKDGSMIAGAISFGDELKDMIFLLGVLFFRSPNKNLILLHNREHKLTDQMPKCGDVLDVLSNQGISKISFTEFSIEELVGVIKFNRKDFMEYLEKNQISESS